METGVVPRSSFVSSLYSFYVGKFVAVLAADLVTGEIAGDVPSPERGPALAEAVQDGFLVEHGLLFGCTALSFLFLRPLQESGFQCIDRSDDYRVWLS